MLWRHLEAQSSRVLLLRLDLKAEFQLTGKKFYKKNPKMIFLLEEIFLVLWYIVETLNIRSRFPSKIHTKRFVMLGQ